MANRGLRKALLEELGPVEVAKLIRASIEWEHLIADAVDFMHEIWAEYPMSMTQEEAREIIATKPDEEKVDALMARMCELVSVADVDEDSDLDLDSFPLTRIALLERAITHPDESLGALGRAELESDLGGALASVGRIKDALVHHEVALNLVQEQDHLSSHGHPRDLVGQVLANYAQTLDLDDHHSEAIIIAEKALDHYRRAKEDEDTIHSEGLATALLVLAKCLGHNGQIDDATARLQEGFELLESISSASTEGAARMAAAQLMLGDVLLGQTSV